MGRVRDLRTAVELGRSGVGVARQILAARRAARDGGPDPEARPTAEPPRGTVAPRRPGAEPPRSGAEPPRAQEAAVAVMAPDAEAPVAEPPAPAPQPSPPAPAPPVLPVEEAPRLEPAPAEAPPRRTPGWPPRPGIAWGWVSVVALLASIGLFGTVAGGALARTGRDHAEAVFWAGLLLMVVPVAARLAARGPSRGERVLLAAGLGIVLYLTKVLHDPFAFTYADELIHLRNADDIVAAGGLFPSNSLLSVTIFYPGLEAVTAGLATLGGISPFTGGLIVVGAARLLMMLALFLLFERLAGSARLAGLAALVYVANPNFLFWSAQFSYESLALPLATLATVAVAMRINRRTPSERFGWALVAMIAIAAVTMTHHLTTYAVLVLLVGLSLTAAVVLRRPRQAEWGLALFAAAATAAWLIQVAPATDHYLTDIFRRSFEGVGETLTGESEGRALFESPRGDVTPLWQRAVAIGSIALIAAVLPFGLLRAWWRRRRAALAFVLALGAAAYLVILPLRLVPSAWETASRASDFLYVGIGLAIATAGLHHLLRRRPVLRTAAVCLFAAVIVVGGVLAGWPPNVRLSQPYVVEIGGRTVEPQGRAMADWSRAVLGPRHRFVADESNGRFLLAYGGQLPLPATNGLAEMVLEPAPLTPEAARDIVDRDVDYVVVDRRAIANDTLAGYFFAPRGTPREGAEGEVPPELIDRFDAPGAQRLFDSGDIVVYDLRELQP